jgi:hypothetical protein
VLFSPLSSSSLWPLRREFRFWKRGVCSRLDMGRGQMHLLVQRGRASWRVGPHPGRILPRSEAATVTTPSRTRVLAPIVFLRCDVTPSHRSTKRALLVPSSARAPDEARVGDSPLLRLDLQRRVCRRPSVGVVRSMMTREKVPYILHRFPLNVQNFLLRFYLSKF